MSIIYSCVHQFRKFRATSFRNLNMVFTGVISGALNSAAVWATIVVGALIVYYMMWKQKRSKMITAIDKLPGPEYHSILGHALQLHVKREVRHFNLLKLLKPFCDVGIARIWIGHIPRVFLLNAEAAEPIMSSNFEINKGQQYKILDAWVGDGLVKSKDKKWFARRKMLTPTFHFAILEQFLETFNEQSELLCKNIESQLGSTLEMFMIFKLLAMNIICETAMGLTVDALNNKRSKYVNAVFEMQDIVATRAMSMLYMNDLYFSLSPMGRRQKRVLKVIHDFSNNVIKERKEERQRLKAQGVDIQKEFSLVDEFGRKKRKAFLDLVLDLADTGSDVMVTNEDIREEVDTFMWTGHETFSTLTSWVTYFMGRYPEVQKRVQDELDQVFGDSQRHVTMQDISQLKYLDHVVKETMRMIPIVPLFARKLKNDLKTRGYTIPAGTTVAVQLYMLHHDPKWYPDPEKFDPDRFLPENCATRHPYAYAPFSAGPRNCIGQKYAVVVVKTIIAHLLRKFTVTCNQDMDDVHIIAEVVLKPLNGFHIFFDKRK